VTRCAPSRAPYGCRAAAGSSGGRVREPRPRDATDRDGGAAVDRGRLRAALDGPRIAAGRARAARGPAGRVLSRRSPRSSTAPRCIGSSSSARHACGPRAPWCASPRRRWRARPCTSTPSSATAAATWSAARTSTASPSTT
jgi:hypothetical protein